MDVRMTLDAAGNATSLSSVGGPFFSGVLAGNSYRIVAASLVYVPTMSQMQNQGSVTVFASRRSPIRCLRNL